MEPMDPSLWDASALVYDEEVDFANAPTPFMSHNFADLNDIESDDLLDLDNGLDLGLVDNEVEVGVEQSHLTHLDQTLAVSVPEASPVSPKRKVRELYNDSSDESSDEERSQPDYKTARSSGKSRAGRKPSKASNKCMSRNAIAARENREKKKAYVMEVEKKLIVAEEEIRKNRSQISSLLKSNEELVNEVDYLKGILANDSSISSLIKHMSSANQIQLVGTQFVSDSKPARKSHRIASSKGESSPPVTQTSGICLHIHNKKVSLELCSKCSVKHNSKGK